MNAYGTERRPSLLAPIRGERLYLNDMRDGWWPDVERDCPHGHGRLFLEPSRGDAGGRIYCLICSWEHPASVLDTRLYGRATSPPMGDCRSCGAWKPAGRPNEHWRQELCADCWAARGGGAMISAKIVADSVNPAGCRLTTFECVVPKWLIAEINTHAMIRRNSASSRAVPTVVLIEKVLSDPYQPLEWRYRNPEGGMQAGNLMSEEDAALSTEDWLGALHAIQPYVTRLERRKAAKEHVNRLLEPWMWSVVVMHATEWDQYLHQRGPSGGAQPEFKQLVSLQIEAFEASQPVYRQAVSVEMSGEYWKAGVRNYAPESWHLPYVTDEERRQSWAADALPKFSAARCAGVSYYRQGSTGDLQKEWDRATGLVTNGHWSPLDMPSVAIRDDRFVGPLRGWVSFRKFFGGESGSKTHGRQEDAPWIRR